MAEWFIVLVIGSFSILSRIVGAATQPGPAMIVHPDGTFSILSRIVGAATRCTLFGLLLAYIAFQYPRSDRRRCNGASLKHKEVQYGTFSILGRIGGDATFAGFLLAFGGLVLSVSSVGSEAMQRTRGCDCKVACRAFQYPRSDRRRCN